MKKFFLCMLILSGFIVIAQNEPEERLDDKIDQITYDWDLEADKLSSYEGLQNLCVDESYRLRIFSLLNDIHHYDTILYGVLLKLQRTNKDREIDKALKDIKKFEQEYNTKSFIHFMNEECKALIDIEKRSEDTRNEVGFTSYSSQVYILETELFRYVKHITDRVDKIRRHVHHLSSHYQN